MQVQDVYKRQRLRCQKEAVLIYCGEHEQICAFDLPELQAADEFWEMPYRRERVRLRMEDTFRRMKTEYDLCTVSYTHLSYPVCD